MPGPSSGSSSSNTRPYAKDRQRPTALPVIFHPRPFPSRSILESSFGFKLFLMSAVRAVDFDATGDDCSMSIRCIRNAGTVPCLPLSYLLHAAACVPPVACQCPALSRCWSRCSSLAPPSRCPYLSGAGLGAGFIASAGGGRGKGGIARLSGDVGSCFPLHLPPTNVCVSHAGRVSECAYTCVCVCVWAGGRACVRAGERACEREKDCALVLQGRDKAL